MFKTKSTTQVSSFTSQVCLFFVLQLSHFGWIQPNLKQQTQNKLVQKLTMKTFYAITFKDQKKSFLRLSNIYWELREVMQHSDKLIGNVLSIKFKIKTSVFIVLVTNMFDKF